MLRTINYTGRRRLERKEVQVRLKEFDSGPPEFDVDFSLDTTRLPDDAKIYVEASYINTLQRFSYGTVAEIKRPEPRKLNQLDLSGLIQFRVLIVDESAHLAQIVAQADNLRALGDDAEEQKSSLVVLKSRPLGQQTWRVEVPSEGKPELYLNSRIPFVIDRVKTVPLFQALILPAALREVLMFYLWDDEFEDGSVAQQWLKFGEYLAYEKPGTDADASDLVAWVNEVSARFSERFDMCDLLLHRIEEVSS